MFASIFFLWKFLQKYWWYITFFFWWKIVISIICGRLHLPSIFDIWYFDEISWNFNPCIYYNNCFILFSSIFFEANVILFESIFKKFIYFFLFFKKKERGKKPSFILVICYFTLNFIFIYFYNLKFPHLLKMKKL